MSILHRPTVALATALLAPTFAPFPALAAPQLPAARPDTGSAAGQPVSVAGSWSGELSVGVASLRIVFHITRGPDGSLSATMDSPDQGATGIPASEVRVEGDSVHIGVAVAGGDFDGEVASGGDTIRGTWSQSGRTFPLELHRIEQGSGPATGPNESARPQEPRPPFPYRSEDVTVPAGSAGITLAGTLTLPRGEGPFPAVVLLSGSGPQDRDETVFGHKPFLVLADALTRRGVAVLRTDDRGVGGSSGSTREATLGDLVGDALAEAGWLAARPEIDGARIGLLGHSQGGLVAAAAAARAPKRVAFAVLLSTPAIRGDRLLAVQRRALLEAGGASEDRIALNDSVAERLETIGLEEIDSATARRRFGAAIDDLRKTLPPKQAKVLESLLAAAGPDALAAQLRAVSSPAFRSLLRFDPDSDLTRMRQPVLAVYGGHDLQVPPAANAPEMRKALSADPDAKVEVLPGLNHLLQPAATGMIQEYARIDTTMSEKALDTVGSWIEARTGLSRRR